MFNKFKVWMEENNKYIYNAIKYLYVHTIKKYKLKKIEKSFVQEGENLLIQLDLVFQELDIDYWLEFGTLLGAVREKSFISHDLDIDVGVFARDYHDTNEEIFRKYGFKKVREFLVDEGEYAREETYEYKGIGVDLFYFHLRNNDTEMYCHTFAPQGGKSRGKTIQDLGGLLVRELRYPHEGFKKIIFLGQEFMVPANIEEHLKLSYGENYMIPDPNYSNSIATNVRFIKNKIGIRNLYKDE